MQNACEEADVDQTESLKKKTKKKTVGTMRIREREFRIKVRKSKKQIKNTRYDKVVVYE